MSPEHLQGQPTDSRSDIFAAGTILFEMVAGEPAFAGKTIAELFHAIVYEPPKSLTGAAAILDDVVRGALAKNPDDRFPTAEAMANQLRSVLAGTQTKAPSRGRPTTRLIVLPFYQLRPDEETAFLCFSLPDAISSSLAGLHSLVVRSSRVAARFGGSTIDLKSIAAETEVDAVMLSRATVKSLAQESNAQWNAVFYALICVMICLSKRPRHGLLPHGLHSASMKASIRPA